MHNHLSLDHLLHSNSTSENKKGSPPSSNLIKEVKVFHPTTNPTTSLTSFALHLFSKKEGEREGSLTFNNSPVVSLESMTQPSSSLALTPFPLFSTSTSTTSTSTSTSTSNGHSNSNSHFSVPSSTFFNENNPSQFDSWSKWLPWANSYLSSTSSNKLISLPHSPPPPPPPPPLPPFIHPIMISQHTNPHPHPHPLPHQQQSLLQPQQQYFHYYCRPPLPSEGSSFSHFNASSNDPLTIPFHRRSSLPSTVFSYPTTSFTNTFSGSMHTLLQRGDPTNTLLHHPPPFTSSSTSTHSTQPEPKHFDVATSHLPSNPRSLSLQSKPLHASSLSYPPPFNPFLTSIPTDLSTSTPFTSTSTATMQATSTHPSSVLTYSPPPSSENGFQAFSLFTPSTLSAPFLPHSPSTSQCTQDLTTTPSLSIPTTASSTSIPNVLSSSTWNPGLFPSMSPNPSSHSYELIQSTNPTTTPTVPPSHEPRRVLQLTLSLLSTYTQVNRTPPQPPRHLLPHASLTTPTPLPHSNTNSNTTTPPPALPRRTSFRPFRIPITHPTTPTSNDGLDNKDHDLLLYVQDTLHDQGIYEILKYPEDNEARWKGSHMQGPGQVLGKGTFGQVVLCQHRFTKEKVAIKVIKNHPDYFKQSVMEVRVLQLLNTKYDPYDQCHIIRLKDSFIFRHHLCLVFELLSNNLYDVIQRYQFRGLPYAIVQHITYQLVEALCCLSEAQLIHCDLKPENILLCSPNSYDIKLIDFGSACSTHHTMYTYLQSRFYRSPEVLLGLPYTNSIDIWSLGCIVAELMLGLPLFPGSSEYNQLERIVEALGSPPSMMIEVSQRGKLYFQSSTTQTPAPTTTPSWTFLPRHEFYLRTGRMEPVSKIYFPSTQLNDLFHDQPAVLLDFLKGCLHWNPMQRWTAQQAKKHAFLNMGSSTSSTTRPSTLSHPRHPSPVTDSTAFFNASTQHTYAAYPTNKFHAGYTGFRKARSQSMTQGG